VLIGLAMAALGVPLFFGESLDQEEVGLGLVTLGLGIALLTVLATAGRKDVAEARRSKGAALAGLVLLPHLIPIWILGLGLVAFGAAILAIAARLI
jgi:hypothetical protein